MRHKFTKEESSRGGKQTVARHGTEHMAKIGSKGFWAMLESYAEKLPPDAPPYALSNRLAYLKAHKGA